MRRLGDALMGCLWFEMWRLGDVEIRRLGDVEIRRLGD
jgi:hypothetical protein